LPEPSRCLIATSVPYCIGWGFAALSGYMAHLAQ
jgi:hypothetical protein